MACNSVILSLIYTNLVSKIIYSSRWIYWCKEKQDWTFLLDLPLEMVQKFDILCNRRFSPMCKFSFLQISRKVKVLELRVVLSANINMHIAVILSYVWAFYDHQKLIYGHAQICGAARDFCRDFRHFLQVYEMCNYPSLFQHHQIDQKQSRKSGDLLVHTQPTPAPRV